MREVLDLDLDWITIVPYLAKVKKERIKYAKFLSKYKVVSGLYLPAYLSLTHQKC